MAKIRNPLPLTLQWNGPNKREYFIDSLVKKNNWKIGCEVGVRTGRTLFHLLDANPTLKMYAVDKDVSQFDSQKIRNKYKDRLVIIEGDSSTSADLIKERLDFVFIDAGHGTKSVMKDINAYSPKLNDTKGLLGHDIDFPAIQTALDNLSIDYGVGPDNVWFSS